MFYLQRTQLSIFLKSTILGVHKAIVNQYCCLSEVTLTRQSFLTVLFPQELHNIKNFGNQEQAKNKIKIYLEKSIGHQQET